MIFAACLYIEHHQYSVRRALEPINSLYLESAVSGLAHVLMTDDWIGGRSANK